MTDPEPTPEDHARLAEEWRRVDPEGVAALERSAEELTRKSQTDDRETIEDVRLIVGPGELDEDPGYPGIQGARIEELNLVQLKALAKHREIVLGARKDKKELILQALREGA